MTPDDELLLDLLERWEEARAVGNDIPAEDFCRDRPDLLDALRGKIAALRASDWMRQATPAQAGSRTLAGRYRLERLIGQGSYGQVWLAYDEELHRPVAVKVPNPRRRLAEDQIDLLLAEARRVARLRHPAIVTVHDVLKEGTAYVIVNDLIDGIDLAEKLRGGRLAVEQTVDIVAQVARALDYAHGQGVIHRDIKPSNVLLDREGGVHVCDFGIAATQQELLDHHDRRATLAYASPEQLGDGPVDHRTDIWSLGVLLYEMLAGRRPFDADDPIRLRQQTLDGEPSGLTGVPEAVAEACKRCLAKRPAGRFARGNDLADALEAAARRPSRRTGWWSVAAILAFVPCAVLLGWSLSPRSSSPHGEGPEEPPGQVVLAQPDRDDSRRVLRGHDGAVRAVAITPNGDLVGSGGEDGTLRLWGEAEDDKTVIKHAGPVTALAFAEGGRCLLAGSGEGTVTLWGLPPRTAREHVVAGLGVLSVPLTGPWPVVAALAPRPERPWPMRAFPAQVGPVRAVAISADGRIVAFAGKRKLEIWEAGAGQPLTVAETPGEIIHALTFFRGGLISGAFGFDAEQRLTTRSWLMTKVNELWVASPRPAGLNLELFTGVRGFAVAPDLSTVLVTQADAVRVFARDGLGAGLQLTGSYESPRVPLVMTASLPGGRAVTVGRDRTLRLWSTTQPRELAFFQGHARPVTALAVSEDGGTTATASEDGTVRLWRTPSYDREMAERVLELVGAVTVEQRAGTTRVANRADMPVGNFRLAEVDLSRAEKVADEDVDRLQALAALRTLKLPGLDPEFLLGHVYAGASEDGTKIGFRLTAIDGVNFRGDHLVHGADGVARHQAKVTGTIDHGQIRYAYARADIVKDGGYQPCRFAGTITRTRIKLTWELAEGNGKGIIIMKPAAKD